MAEDRRWMYGGWNKSGAHSREWSIKTQEFIDRAFSLSNTGAVKCPCSRCRNSLWHDKRKVSLDLCKWGFMPGYEVWVHHGESIRQTASVVEEDDRTGDDRMTEMLDAIRPEFETNPEDPPTPEVQKIFDILSASEEPLHEHTTISVLAFLTRLMDIKSKFAFSNNCFKELVNLISDVLPMNHKMPKDMYETKKMLFAINYSYARIQANNQYYKEVLGQPMSEKLGSSAIYLTEEQYSSVRIPWFKNRDADYFEFCKLWSSSAFKLVSEKNRLCRGSEPKHTYGGDGHIRKAKRMEARTGVVPTDVDVYIAGHKGPDPSDPDQLCSQPATERLMQYGQEMVKHHGAEYDWRNQPIDPMAVYTSGGGKTHGRYGMCNGIIDSREVRARKSTQSSQSSEVNSVRRHSEEELEVIRLKEAMRQQDDYIAQRDDYIAQRDEYYAACLAQQQALIQQLAQHQGLDMSQYQPPQPPPRPPPFGSSPAAHVFHTPSQDGGSSSNPNDLHGTTPRGSAQHSNQPSQEN